MIKRVSMAAVALLIVAGAIWAGVCALRHSAMAGGAAQAAGFQPPPDSAIPNDQFGDVVRQGERIFHDTGKYAPAFVGNKLSCVNCHLAGGRLANSAPMWAAYISYPAYRSKNGHVNTFAERLQGCFRYSMNGKAPPIGDPTLVALETYAYFLAKGAPTGVPIQGRGFPRLPKPDKPADYQRGMGIYAQSCAMCHGANGEGKYSDGHLIFPPLWGAQSYNWGAGMAGIGNAAGFIKANMPLDLGGTLTVQQAWDVATYIDSQVRPQDPRFTGDVGETRKKYHNSKSSMYGTTVNGVLLGDPAHTPPSGTVPPASAPVVAGPQAEVDHE